MTREEAIICLQGLLDNPLINKGSYLAQALEMAIKALEHPEQNVIAVVPCGDAISREAAIDIIAETDITNGTEPVFTGKQVQALLKDLPSVKPIPCSDAISRRAVLKLFATNDGKYLYEAIRDLPSVTPKQTEITLESAIDYLHSIGWLQKHDKEMTECAERTGHWIETADEYYKAVNEYGGGVDENTPYFTDDIGCSVCLAMFSTIDNETERFKYCPNCGAKMESEEQAEKER